MNRTLVLLLVVLGTGINAVPYSDASSHSIAFDSATYFLSSGQVGGSAVKITVTDSSANLDSGAIDTVTINVSSDTDTLGISLVLSETGVNTGIFENTNLIFMEANWQFAIANSVTVTVDDSSADTTAGIDSTSVTVVSESDGTGITVSLQETSGTSGIFTGTLQFTTGTSSGNAIKVAQGDIVSIFYAPSSQISNALIIPNPDSGKGALQALVGDTITATYDSVSDTATIGSSGGGGGGGGIARAGLVVDAVAGFGGGCRSDCTPPTLGVTSNGIRLVTDGFSYNGNTVDVQLYYTPYPLIPVEVGQKNTAVLKVYENGGIENIRHVELGFGIGKDKVISQSKAVINYDIFFDGTASVDVFDPEDALDEVDVSSRPVPCTDQSLEEKCLEVTINHMFRTPLEFNMVGTNTWDAKRNSWQNYYNHGIEITGESLNPPKTVNVLDRVGHLHTITLIDSEHGIDKSGKLWYKEKFWTQEIDTSQRHDVITSHGIDRNHMLFYDYMLDQTKIAQKTLDEIVRGKIIHNSDYGKNYYLQIYPESVSRSENELLQKQIIQEILQAQSVVNEKWPYIMLTKNDK
ncbi:hypothetical protein [Candidatus Nitrosopumilus sediminis]|nr:hypothetical protein [Candidatus Nitrosopumilus sediminis]